MNVLLHTPYEVLYFWFNELDREMWFIKDPELDKIIAKRFLSLHIQAAHGELHFWRKSAAGRLAEIIILDQFSRNIYRGDKRAFANDSLALILAEEMVYLKLDKILSTEKRTFVYLPFMHSESRLIHDYALKLFHDLGDTNTFEYELMHKDIIDKFGRYPHRNQVLGRESTSEELTFLNMHPGF